MNGLKEPDSKFERDYRAKGASLRRGVIMDELRKRMEKSCPGVDGPIAGQMPAANGLGNYVVTCDLPVLGHAAALMTVTISPMPELPGFNVACEVYRGTTRLYHASTDFRIAAADEVVREWIRPEIATACNALS